MCDVRSGVSELRRPKLLVHAAQHRAKSFRRERHLPRLLPDSNDLAKEVSDQELLALEAALDSKRKARAADYDICQHIEVLSALITEAQTDAPQHHPIT